MITILGWIFVALIAVWLIAHIVLYFVNLFRDDIYRGLTIDTYCWWSTFDGWVIIPTIEVEVTNWFSIIFKWIGISYEISIHAVSETEDDLIARARIEQNKKKDEK